jgi:hypothetical protein
MGEGKKRALVIGIDEYEDEQGFRIYSKTRK